MVHLIRPTQSWTGVIVIVAGLTAFAADEKKPERIAFAKVPKAIQAAIREALPRRLRDRTHKGERGWQSRF